MSQNNSILESRTDIESAVEQEAPFDENVPYGFAIGTGLAIFLYDWALRYVLSGTAILTFILLLGASRAARVLPVFPLWSLLITLNFVYFVAATSWLLYGLFAVGCYPIILLVSIFQFDAVARFVRKELRHFVTQLSFISDTIAFFDIPALEIDTDVDGLMVIRGITLSLSSLTLVAHGIEVGIKLSDDMELALSVEKVHIPLFRKIDIGDVYAAIKGGKYEMTFGDMAESTKDADGDAVMIENTPLLQAAAKHGVDRPPMMKMTSKMTNGETMKDSSAKSGFKSMTQLSPDDAKASKAYDEMLAWIARTNTIAECRETVKKRVKAQAGESNIDLSKTQDMRAAICSQMHNKPSVPHPPARSVKVTTLQNLSPPWVRRIMHKLPMLLRLLLNPISYFHPVKISSITAVGSGKWISETLKAKVFKDYSDSSAELRRLEERILGWLSDANFAFELADITGLAQVPFLSHFNIICLLGIDDIMAYRTLPNEVNLNQVIRLGGADATFTIPSYLLPHHEHLLPPIPSSEDKEEIEEEANEADGKPKTVQKEKELEQAMKDECNVKISAHARLPAVFDQELLDFIAALVKATKVVELEKAPNAMDGEINSVKDFTSALGKGMKDSMKKTVVDGIVNDRWIAKIVGKVTAKLEEVVGDIGYSGDIPVALAPYRLPDGHPELQKLLA